MQATDVSRAVAAAKSTASALGLTVDDAVVLQNSNKLTLRLLPGDILARVGLLGDQVLQFEVELAGLLAKSGSPVAALDPRIPPRVYERDGFAVTFWTYHASVTPHVAPVDYARSLRRLHIGMRKIEMATPRFTDRVAEAERLLANRHLTPELADVDRAFLGSMLQSLTQTILDCGAAEQLLHGEPHPGNVLSTGFGPLFIDLETCCRGPVEFDLAHVPDTVVEHYPDVDPVLLSTCRALVLVMVAAWRWDAGDQFPNGRHWAEQLIRTLRKGPPWPSLDAMTRRLAGS
ncbi:MAG TPA: aminoglycoside phosphotransferase family protein [Mesorhizobium sp.]|uniref:aminoglycoside phosphotransferase family protein n=1 Tax=Mesorhizobium sp. TaxID=1871066 RepID=UPI002DDDB692|nr:aminoglycoside phosphotransferase family protein [Mesorhizobium sp.]HEV2506481.1 aminoglycoside phosphotransferase family protein [Mesorhizobium sp.]